MAREGRRPVFLPSWRNWQTRMVQVHVPARVWGFEFLRWHHSIKMTAVRDPLCPPASTRLLLLPDERYRKPYVRLMCGSLRGKPSSMSHAVFGGRWRSETAVGQ